MKAKFYGKVENGRRVYDSPEIGKLWIKRLEGKRFEETISEEKQDGTDAQRGYYFACIVKSAVNEGDFVGWTAEEIDGYLVRKFLTVDRGTPKERIRSRSSDAGFTREDWSEFIDRCIKDMAEHGVIVLPPNKSWFNIKE